MAEHHADVKPTANVLDAWDPLAPTDDDVDMFAAAQKREIRNILKSYTGYYDLFSEMVQNALDAVEKRAAENVTGYESTIVITIDIQQNTVSVTDNGCSMSLAQFKRFLKPNFSFKDGPGARGSKGVGATYLAFGFNHLEVATKPGPGTTYAGILRDGRTWLDDTKGIIPRPTVEPVTKSPATLDAFDRGTSITLKLTVEVKSGGSLESGSPQILFQPPIHVNPGQTEYCVTRDGKRFIFREPVGETGARFTVVLNWAAGLKK